MAGLRRPCIAAVAAFVIAQVLKVFTYWYSERRWDATRLIGSGGMPSSHTGCVSLCPPRLPTCAHLYSCIQIKDGSLIICLSVCVIRVSLNAMSVQLHGNFPASRIEESGEVFMCACRWWR